MDLKKLQEKQELIDVPLVFGDDGEPTDGFKVVGANSQEYQDVDRELKQRNVQRNARRGRGIDAASKNGAEELVELIGPKREFSVCVACIKEIYGFTVDGVAAQLNEETLKQIFSARPMWRGRVVAAVEADQGFTPA